MKTELVHFDENGDGKGEIYYWGSIVNEFYIREAYGNDRNNKENNKKSNQKNKKKRNNKKNMKVRLFTI